MKKQFGYTQLNIYKQCPYKYKMLYIDKVKIPVSDEVDRGMEIHREMDEIIRNKKLTENEKLNDFIQRYIYSAYDRNGFISIEGKIQKIIYDIFDIALRVDIFVIYQDHAMIIDWKTGWSDGNEAQLKLYALYLLKRYDNMKYFECIFYYLDKEYYTKTIYSKEDILEFEKWLLKEFTKLMKDNVFERKPNEYCHNCPFINECEKELSRYKLPEKITSNNELFAVIQRIQLAEEIVKKGKDLVREYMTENNIPKIVDNRHLIKAEINTTTSLKIGSMTKNDLIDVIIKNNLSDKSRNQLSKLKVGELKALILER